MNQDEIRDHDQGDNIFFSYDACTHTTLKHTHAHTDTHRHTQTHTDTHTHTHRHTDTHTHRHTRSSKGVVVTWVVKWQ